MIKLKPIVDENGKVIRSGIVQRLSCRPETAYNGRPLVVILEPGDILGIREQGRRTVYRANLGWVYMQLARKFATETAEKKRKERAERRKQR